MSSGRCCQFSGFSSITSLIAGPGGSYYGTTYGDGDSGKGTVFRFTSDGALTTLLSFAGTNDANPAAELLAGSDGSMNKPAAPVSRPTPGLECRSASQAPGV